VLGGFAMALKMFLLLGLTTFLGLAPTAASGHEFSEREVTIPYD
jgi:hypothetical protein